MTAPRAVPAAPHLLWDCIRRIRYPPPRVPRTYRTASSRQALRRAAGSRGKGSLRTP